MKAKEIKVGGHYMAKVSGKVVEVRVDVVRQASIFPVGHSRGQTIYDVTNMKTGRKTTFRSAAKFRGPVVVVTEEQIKERQERIEAIRNVKSLFAMY